MDVMDDVGGIGGLRSKATLKEAEILRPRPDYLCHSLLRRKMPAHFSATPGSMVPELPEGICPVTVLHPLTGAVAHLAAELRVRRQAADRLGKIIHI